MARSTCQTQWMTFLELCRRSECPLPGQLVADDVIVMPVVMIRSKFAYPSLKVLGGWFNDLLLRVAALEDWKTRLKAPVSVWISGMFNPMVRPPSISYSIDALALLAEAVV